MCENLLDMRVCVCNLQDLVYNKIFFIKMLSYHGRYQIKLRKSSFWYHCTVADMCLTFIFQLVSHTHLN